MMKQQLQQIEISKQEYRKNWYKQNKDKVIENKKNQLKRNKKFYYEYMKDKKCAKCGSGGAGVVLHNHHINPNDPRRKDKKLGIYYLVRSRYSINTIKEELKLTVVMCRECHCALTVFLQVAINMVKKQTDKKHEKE